MPSGVIDVAAGLLERDGLILITQRKQGSHLAGLWEFPGGKREPAETWQDCLVRELQEELAITVTVGELRYETVHHYPEKSVRLRFYAAALISGSPGLSIVRPWPGFVRKTCPLTHFPRPIGSWWPCWLAEREALFWAF